MAWAFPVSDVDTNTIVALGNGDGVFVGSGIVIASTASSPTVDGNDNQHKAIVHGTVVGNLLAITLGVQGGSNLGHEVTIGGTGVVEALAANGIALLVAGGNSTVLNEGLIQALDGFAVVMDSVSFFGHGSSFSNAGTIRAGLKAIIRSAGSSETLTFTNSGLVEAPIAYDTTNFFAKDLITNTGRIVGVIGLGQGDDVYNGASGRLSGIVGGSQGKDQLIGGIDDDRFEGGTQDDTLTGNAGNDWLQGGADNDTLAGGAGSDLLDGGAGADTMLGGADSDTFLLGEAGDVVNEVGGSGIDLVRSTISFNLANAVRVFGDVENLTLVDVAPAANGTGNGLNNTILGNSFVNVLNGQAGNDRLLGGLAGDTLNGAAGADVLHGEAGNDTLTGGAGIDTLVGGANNDTFVFNAGLAAANRDVITDFFAPQDSFQLENAVFTKLGAGVHALNPAFLRVGATALDANDFIVYNKATGALFYDANANAAGGAVQFATLSNKAAISAADFFVI